MSTATLSPIQEKPAQEKRRRPVAGEQKTTKQFQRATKETDHFCNSVQIAAKNVGLKGRSILVLRAQNLETKRTSLKVIATNPTSKTLASSAKVCTGHLPCKPVRVECQKALPDLVAAAAEGKPTAKVLSLPRTPSMPDCYLDPDSGETDPQMCSEYAMDIYNHQLRVERKEIYLIEAGFLVSSQFTVKPEHRCILVDWLIQVQQRYHLLNETMYLCIDILDRLIQAEPTIPRSKLQLVGVTALFLASKFEEIYPPTLAEFVYLTDGAYTTKEVLEKEIDILQKLDYQLNRPFPLHFLRRYSTVMGTSMKIHQLAKYILELSMLDHVCSSLLPSKRAGAALLLAASILDPAKSPFGLWERSMTFNTKYRCSEFHEEKLKLKKALRTGHGSPKVTAIRRKHRDGALSNPTTLTTLARL